MEMYRLWCKAAIAIVVISMISCQRIRQTNEHSTTLNRTKQNNNRALDTDVDSNSRLKSNHDNDSGGGGGGSGSGSSDTDDADADDDDDHDHDDINEAIASPSNESNQPHSRKKRLIWITDDGRLALPPGTVLSITPTLSLPLVRYPLEGFLSNMTMSFPLTIDFDKLGLTDNENPLGVLPPIFGARNMGRAAGSALVDYIGDYLLSRRARSLEEQSGSEFMTIKPTIVPKLPDKHKHAFHGGERAILYSIAEDFLSTFGVDGKACILRTICEIHSKKTLAHLGFLGEVAKLFFTATKSNYAHLLTEYVTAQQIGEGKLSPGECFPYYKKCPKSLFKSGRAANKYSHIPSEVEQDSDFETDEFVDLNDVENELTHLNKKKDAAQSMFNM